MTANRWLVLVVLVVLAFCVWTLPAHAAAPQPQPPTVKLYVYPKLLPPQEGEEVIKDPNALRMNNPEDSSLPDDPFEAAKDPRTWA
jgi:hypothetical protein